MGGADVRAVGGADGGAVGGAGVGAVDTGGADVGAVGGAEVGGRGTGFCLQGTCRQDSGDIDGLVFRSTVVESINSLRDDVAALRSELRSQREAGRDRQLMAPSPVKFCSLYLRVSKSLGVPSVGKTMLEELLKCQVVQYLCIKNLPSPVFRVKILECDLRGALDAGRKSGCFVDLWRGPRDGIASQKSDAYTGEGRVGGVSKRTGLKMTCWNCRGLSNSLPYLEALMAEGSKVLVLSEHWLWPYDLDKLGQISGDYEAVGKADCRLTEEAEGGRGFGGVGILWHKSIGATPIGGIASDRICGIRFSVDDGDRSVMSVIGVYLPCLDQGLDCYKEHVIELERVISESELLGPVAVLGDFNAHLGGLGGHVGVGESNLQGVLLQDVMDRCSLSAVSLGSLASGPGYTYCSGEVRTTVDYILMDVRLHH